MHRLFSELLNYHLSLSGHSLADVACRQEVSNPKTGIAARIMFGSGILREIGPIAVEMGNHALVVVGSTVSRAAMLLDALNTQRIQTTIYSVTKEPTVELVRQGVQKARGANCNLVIGFGGGSAVDAGKAIAALLTNNGAPLDYLEVIGKGQPLTQPPAPYIAIPTTAGTGAEVTRNAVLLSPEHQVKVSLRSLLMLPRLALVDPELTYSLPPTVTASTGLDALTQVVEPYVSHQANPLTDALCREGMLRAARSLRRAYENGTDAAAREDMSLVSLFGGLALANAKLGAAHGFAGPMGGMFSAPHGTICGRLLPHVMAINVRTLQERMPESQALLRYDKVAQILTGSTSATAADGVAWVQELCDALQVSPLTDIGVTRSKFPALIEKASASSSMKGNPIKLAPDEMEEILTRAL